MSDDIKNDEDVDKNTYHIYSKRDSVVKVSFTSNYTYKNTNQKNIRIKVCIGSLIAKELQWKHGDHIDLIANSKSIILRKIDSSHKIDSEYRTFKGYKFTKIKNSYSFSLSAGFNYDNNLVGQKIKVVPHVIVKLSHPSGKKIKALKVFLEGDEK